MSGRQHDLEQLQRWMQWVITHPEGVAAGVASEEARQEIPVTAEEVEQVVRPSRALSALERLAIYGGAYYARLLECLREEFPALVHAAGDEAFEEFAVGYLQTYPSRSYTLGRLGAEFKRFLEEIRPSPEEEEARPGLPDFLIDLATLEWTYNEVFDGPGVEGEKLLEGEQLRTLPPESWPEARLIPVCCLRLLALRFPVHEYVTAYRHQQDPAPPEPAETFLAITRRDYVVQRHPLSRGQYEFLAALVSGQPVGQAISQAAQAAGPDLEEFAAQLQQWFQTWAAQGFFCGVEFPRAIVSGR